MKGARGGGGVSGGCSFVFVGFFYGFSLLADDALKVFKIIFCYRLSNWVYGLDCRSNCSQGCKNEACERENGYCTLGCKTSLEGPMCKMKGLFYVKAIKLSWPE